MGRNFFSQSGVNRWNSFPQRAGEAGGVGLGMFEAETDRLLISEGIPGIRQESQS